MDEVIAPEAAGAGAEGLAAGGAASNESNIDEVMAPEAAGTGAGGLATGGGGASKESNIDEVMAPEAAVGGGGGAGAWAGFGGAASNPAKIDDSIPLLLDWVDVIVFGGPSNASKMDDWT